MNTLIGALLIVTAFSPAVANAQRFGMEASAPVDREDGRSDNGPGARSRGALDDSTERPRFARGDSDNPADRRPDADRDGRRGDEDRGAHRRGGEQAHRSPGSRGPDRSDVRGDSRFDRRSVSDHYDDPRGRDDWTRSRLDQRDDGWTRSRFAERAAWNRGWRGNDRYDWNGYRTAHRGAYRLPRYTAPGRYDYRRFAIGTGLDASLWNRAYWIADPYAYRLPQAYGPYRWVRYYDDALLVDQRGGRVVDAVYGIFW